MRVLFRSVACAQATPFGAQATPFGAQATPFGGQAASRWRRLARTQRAGKARCLAAAASRPSSGEGAARRHPDAFVTGRTSRAGPPQLSAAGDRHASATRRAVLEKRG